MAIEPALQEALRPFERRAIFVAFVEGVLVTAFVSLIATEIGFASGFWNLPTLVSLPLAGILISAIYAFSRRPNALALARRIDARGRLSDLVVTAVTCKGDGLTSLVRRSAVAELARVPRATAYPFEAPRFWRQALIAAFVAQAAILPFALRPPAERARPQDLTGLTLPQTTSAAAPASRPNSDQKSVAPSTPETAQPSANMAAQQPGMLEPATKPGEAGGAAGSDSGDRIGLAAANAEADIAAGRVPLARREIVKRYFSAIDIQRKRPR